MDRAPGITRFAWLSIAAAVVTIALKAGAWWLTGSVGLLSDALESVVNLVAASLTLWMLAVASQPADEEHAHGHGKAEYFASGAEGALILLAAVGIAWTAVQRLVHPQPVEQPLLGVLVSCMASAVNFVVARILHSAAKRSGSIALEADAQHLMTDVWTSVGVVFAIGIVALTGYARLDPLIAIAVAVNIVRTGVKLVSRSASGLLDVSLPETELKQIRDILEKHAVRFHALRTRQAGTRRFVSMHVLVPGDWTVARGHELVEQIEHDVRTALPGANVLTHLEPVEDPVSYEDEALDR